MALRPDELARARQGRRYYVSGEDRLGQAGPLRVVAVPAGPPDDPQTVIVARPVGEGSRKPDWLGRGIGLAVRDPARGHVLGRHVAPR